MHVPKGKTPSQKITCFLSVAFYSFYSLSVNAKLPYSHKAYRSEVSPVAETNLHFHVSPTKRRSVMLPKQKPGRMCWWCPKYFGQHRWVQKNRSQMSNVPFFLFQRSERISNKRPKQAADSLASYLEWGSDSMCALLLVLPQQKWKGGPSKDRQWGTTSATKETIQPTLDRRIPPPVI